MFSRLKSLLRVTAVRLSIIYTVIFGILSVGIVFYMTGATVNVLREQYQTSIDQELTNLARVYRRGGVNFLVRTLERRARAPGANLYVVTNSRGLIIGGNVPRLENGVMQNIGWTKRPFKYERIDDDSDKEHRAIARILEVPNGMRILVGRDITEYEGFRGVVRRGFFLALGTMLILGLLTWFFVGRRALKRIDQVSKSSVRIMSGDRSERLPVLGVNDEFDRLSANLNQMLDRIQLLDASSKEMSDNIAHDLKTPITRLRNKAEVAFSLNNKPEEQQQSISEIIDDCDGIVKTFDALLMISRVEAGATVATLETLEIVSLVNDVHELYEALVEDEEKSLLMTVEVPEDTKLKGNRELLSRAISNLIDNALKYGGKTIKLNVSFEAGMCVIDVTDNGLGIREDEIGKVTKRFVRLEKSRNMNGNGLGLSLVKAITEMHKGKLELSNNDPGLRVRMILPLLD